MKKIGIFTYMLSNYGAVLQCYALQKYLSENKGLDVEVIDFTTKEHLKAASIFNHTIPNKLVRIAYNLLLLLKYPALKKRRTRTISFKKKHIRFSERFDDMESLLSSPPQKDFYVTGSDQVFNLNSLYYKLYYLGFEKHGAKKIAYAPSFGHCQFDDVLWSKISSYIGDFDAISCREQSGADYLSSKTGSSVPYLVDPTLLLEKDEWAQVSEKPNYDRDYILIYDLNGGEKLVDIANEIKSKFNLDIVCITNNVTKRYNVDKNVYDAGPAEFVGWIANAKCVVTDSFHGTVFSVINRKPFYIYIAIPNLATRIHTLLNLINGLDHIVSDEDILSKNYSLTSNLNTSVLEAKISASKDFLKENIK